ncbi:tRNA pseudouridine(55) synthase TruB [Acidicapsa ligni]|uniref:tRNA pseudouridine(55) synthase TruB n=1 Tax=Acidicapsa ligni TaxID=542300 RepID=UPI0021DF87F0|nr:tRNA pseudouridine(55) synthase TruB [Acidicapsa ligni]
MNGLLVVDKSGGMTSHDVVSRVRRLTGEKSVGHLGTLDPMATGVLPLLLGKYTRLAQFFSTAEKTYTGTIRFGFATDTYDAEGIPAGEDSLPSLELEQVRSAASRFHGEIEQMPPAFSAKKVGGVPAYKLAREGKPVELKAVKICIHQFSIDTLEGNSASFQMTVSAGGYVRSVAHELGQVLGCGAHLTSLRRTRAGVFGLDQAWTLDALGGLGTGVETALLHPRNLLAEMPCVSVDGIALGRLRNGAQVNLAEFSDAGMVKVFEGQRELVAIGKRVAGTLFQPIVVMG